jgi:hypothetical protein
MAVAIYMKPGFDQVFVMPAEERFRGSIAGQGIEFLGPALFFAGRRLIIATATNIVHE